MGGVVLETRSEKIRKEAKAQMIVEMGQEYGLDDLTILKRLQDKVGLSLGEATVYFKKYGKQMA